MEFLIITGLSGAGKSLATQTLEDLGFFCVDNLPPTLIPKFAEIIQESQGRIRRVALVIDVRGGEFFDALGTALADLEASGIRFQIVFLDASDEILVRRFEETRRKHPLGGSILDGIRTERRRLQPLKEQAHKIIDTSTLTAKELKEELADTFVRTDGRRTLAVTVTTFGYKYGIPLDADLVFDVRFLPNPYYVEALRPLPGNSPEIREFVLRSRQTVEFRQRLLDMLAYLLPQFTAEGKSHLTVAIGCTGGKHRSVVIGEDLAEFLRGAGYAVRVKHRDMRKE
ncbi:MAG: RNase adapter RapZ [Bacillati bacterium ANGP1]|uniref:RNase adapter RapZ n=1 Tax=Candidatus Segetimicrobium genomatis TaxID=2569760 RepID=A0A537JER5_9BACT|nr:MAG: RNase adapter RapZ [Terrabacteria group bacterium ANGP1]